MTFGSEPDHRRLEAVGGSAFASHELANAFATAATIVPPAVPVLGPVLLQYLANIIAFVFFSAAFIATPFPALRGLLLDAAHRIARCRNPVDRLALSLTLPPSPLAWLAKGAAAAVGFEVAINPLTTPVPESSVKDSQSVPPFSPVGSGTLSLTVGPTVQGARDMIDEAIPLPTGVVYETGEQRVTVAPAYTVTRLVLEADKGGAAAVDVSGGRVVGVEVQDFDLEAATAEFVWGVDKTRKLFFKSGKGKMIATSAGLGVGRPFPPRGGGVTVSARKGVVLAAGSVRSAALVLDARERVEAAMADAVTASSTKMGAAATTAGPVRLTQGAAAGVGGAPLGVGVSFETRKGVSHDPRTVHTLTGFAAWAIYGGGTWAQPREGAALYLHGVRRGADGKAKGAASLTLEKVQSLAKGVKGVVAGNKWVHTAGWVDGYGALGATWATLDTAGGYDKEHFARTRKSDSLLAYYREACAWWAWSAGATGSGVRVRVNADAKAELLPEDPKDAPAADAKGAAGDGKAEKAAVAEAGGAAAGADKDAKEDKPVDPRAAAAAYEAALAGRKDAAECLQGVEDALRVAHAVTVGGEMMTVLTGRCAMDDSVPSKEPKGDAKGKDSTAKGDKADVAKQADAAEAAVATSAPAKEGGASRDQEKGRGFTHGTHLRDMCVKHAELGPLVGTLAMGRNREAAVDPTSMGVRGLVGAFAVGRAVLPGPSVGGDSALAMATSIIGARLIASAAGGKK